jgi:hypothetical protein
MMKCVMHRALCIAVTLLLVPAAASAQLPPRGYFALYFDAGRTEWCYTGTGMVNFYLFVLPNEGGVGCAELIVPPPTGFMIFAEVYNPDIILPVTGTLPTGLAACFTTCWYEWVQIASAALMIPNANPAEVPIIARSGNPFPMVVDCKSSSMPPCNPL